MRFDKDERSSQEREIDDFLSQFDTPDDDISSSDLDTYLSDSSVDNGTDNFTWENFESQNKEKEAEPVIDDKGTKKRIGLSSKAKEKAEKIQNSDFSNTYSSNNKNKEKKEKSERNKSKFKDILIESSTKAQDRSSQHLFAKLSENNDKKTIIDYLFLVDGKCSFKKIIRDCAAAFAAIVTCVMLYCMVSIVFTPSVNPDKIYTYVDTSSMIYDDEGKQVDSVYYTQDRKIIKYKDMPEDLVNSFVAIEDKTFWKHHGFNWTRMVGAVLSSFTSGSISGTSTITQQLARNVYLADTKSVRSVKRKVLEIYYAARIEQAMSKEEIIEAYLNTIYLGYGCYGVDAAAQAYFSKEVKDMNLIECAALAALPQAPESYALVKYGDSETLAADYTTVITTDPETYVANDISKDRRDVTLGLMKDQGYIDESEYNKYHGMDLSEFIKPTISEGAGAYSYFHEYLVDTVIEDLQEEYDLSYEDAERMVYTQGLKIYSTMDSTAQETIVKEFKDDSNFPSVTGASNKDEDGNIISDEGTILLYNYDNFFDEDGNFTLSGKKQVKINSDGSVTIKDTKRLNIYTTEVSEGTDYSLEFKDTYKQIDGTLYSYPGGYINVPSTYKSLDSDGNLVISAQYFADYPDQAQIEDNSVIFTSSSYSLAQKTIQPQAAMVIVGVGTGEIKAMVGGRTTKGEKLLNRALNARQPGSSIKPLAVYGAALQKSYELNKKGKKWTYTDFGIDKQGTKGYGDYITTYSSVADEQTTIEGKAWPKNSSNGYSGKNTFMTAIQQSINTCAVKIQLQVGNDFSAKMLEKFGLSTVVTDESEYNNDMNPSALALGGMVNGVIPLEMALAYASFPAGGKLNTEICYTKVVDRDGKTILESESEQSEVMNEGVAWIMTEVLKTVVTRGIAGAAAISDVQSGGKTGTTNDQYDIWFDGFTPNYAASLWIGTDNNIKMGSMSGPAARLWGKIMNQIPKAKKGSYKKQPDNVISKSGCYFTEGTETGLAKYNPDESKEKALIKKVEAYFKSNDCTIEEACAACGISYSDYVEYGGSIAKGTVSPYHDILLEEEEKKAAEEEAARKAAEEEAARKAAEEEQRKKEEEEKEKEEEEEEEEEEPVEPVEPADQT